MSFVGSNIIAGAAGQGGGTGYEIPRSLRFNPGDSAYLNRNFSSTGNRRTFTLSYWVKESGKGTSPSNNPNVLWAGPDVNTRGGFVHRGTAGDDAGKLYIFNQNSGTTNCGVWSNSLHRDFSAWKHIVWAIDTTQSTGTDRVKLYINGVQETLNFVVTPAQNLELQININQEHRIGRGTPDDYGNFYLAEIHFIDGQALAPTDFGEYDDNNVWQPKELILGSSFNDGTVWSDYLTTTGSFSFSDRLPPKAFDGIASQETDEHCNGGSGQTMTFDAQSAGLPVGTYNVRVWGFRRVSGSHSIFYNATTTSGDTTEINSISQISTDNTYGWIDLGSVSNFTGIKVRGTPSNTGPIIGAVEIDGEILINNSGGNTFHLDFSDNSSNAALGTDSSGLGTTLPGVSFDGSGDYLSVGNSADYNFTGDFTAEAWVYVNAYTNDYAGIFGFSHDGDQQGWNVLLRSSGVPHINVDMNYTNVTNTLPLNKWTHIALVRSGSGSGNVKFYMNGVADPTTLTETDETGTITSAQCMIGAYPGITSRAFNGVISNVRLVKGTALYTSNFTPPTAPLTNVTYTKLLCCQSSNSATAATVSPGTITANGDPFATSLGDTDWTVNNIAAQGNDYLSSFTGTQRSGFEWTKAFDNDLNQGAVPNANTTWTWTPSTPIAFTTLAIYAYKDSSPGGLEINGTSVISQVPNHSGIGPNQRTVITGISSPLTSIKNISYGSLANVVFAGLEIDGTILIASPNSEIDSLVDSPTNSTQTDTGVGGQVVGNYCTWNPLDNGGNTLSNGNLDIAGNGNNVLKTRSTFAMPTSGKWYAEFELNALGNGYPNFGIISGSQALTGAYTGTTLQIRPKGNDSNRPYWVIDNDDASKRVNTTTLVSGSIIQLIYDADLGKVWMGINNIYYGLSSGSTVTVSASDISDGTNPAYTISSGITFFTCCIQYAGSAASINFGQRPFAYTAPSGYKALCTTNLPDPTIADGSTAFDITTWTGDGSGARTVGGLNLSDAPDFVWSKTRNHGYHNNTWDSVRGYGTSATALLTDYLGSANGGTLNSATASSLTFSGGVWHNENARTYVAWAWDAGTSTSNNTDGSITSSVRANASAGFSIVSYTGTGSNATFGHGLNAAPEFLIIKQTNGTGFWVVGHKSASFTSDNYLVLNSTGAASSGGGVAWNNTAPTSSVVHVGTSNILNGSGNTHIAYCFAPVAGYSAFGSYTGNASADGPFVYTGFRPAFLLVKAFTSGSAEHWYILDSVRNTSNVVDNTLFPSLSNAEDTDPSNNFDFLSNGFKLRNTNAGFNHSGRDYLYYAAAEHPFKTARAR